MSTRPQTPEFASPLHDTLNIMGYNLMEVDQKATSARYQCMGLEYDFMLIISRQPRQQVCVDVCRFYKDFEGGKLIRRPMFSGFIECRPGSYVPSQLLVGILDAIAAHP